MLVNCRNADSHKLCQETDDSSNNNRESVSLPSLEESVALQLTMERVSP